jgi:hypothetical protein
MRGYGQFCPVVEALGRWGYQWAAEQLRPDHLDAGLLMWFLRRRVRVDRLPAQRATVQFEFRDHVSIPRALRDGSVTLVGRSDLRCAFGGWIGLSPFVT